MKAWIENQYGDKLAELRVDGEDEFNISEKDWLALLPAFLCEGDTWIVKVEK